MMVLYQTEAVVVGAKNWGEADKMVTLFTRERGLVEAAAFGCRRPRSPLAAGMQLFSYLELQLAEGRRLDTVKQLQLKRHYKKLSEDLSVMAYGALVAEVIREFMPAGVPEPKLFAVLLEVLEAFEQRNPRVTALAAVLQVMEFTGLQLHYERCLHCGKEIEGEGAFSLKEGGVLCFDCKGEGLMPFSEELRKTILALRDLDWQDNGSLKLQGGLIMQAEQITLSHLQNLLGHGLKAMEFINQI
jgi:DNA repair protein RecO (recombination protein O)